MRWATSEPIDSPGPVRSNAARLEAYERSCGGNARIYHGDIISQLRGRRGAALDLLDLKIMKFDELKLAFP